MKNSFTLLFLFCSFSMQAQVNGNAVFDESFVHEIRITFEQENYWDSLEYYYAQYLEFGADKQYMLADVTIDGNPVDSVGVRQKGYFSNWGSEGLKEPLKIDFNEFVSGKRYDGLKKLNLQNGFGDPTLMRDALAYKFMRDAGVSAPRSAYAKVYLNDTYWGLYIMVEQVDNRFLKNWYENKDGNLYKCINNTSLNWQGTDKTSYEDEFELKTNEETDDWSSFIELVEKINDEDNFEDSIATILQMNNYLRVLAADVMMYNWDSYYEHGRNFYVYYDSIANAFQWIPWDYNLAFSSTPTHIVIEYDGDGGGWPGGMEPKPLVEQVMNSGYYRTIYFNHLCLMVDNYFTLENLEAYIDATKELIEEALDEDPNKYYTIDQFSASIEDDITVVDSWGMHTVIPGLKSFISARQTTVSNQLNAEGHSCTALSIDENESAAVPTYRIYPNPSNTGIFTIDLEIPTSTLGVYTLDGKNILTQNVENLPVVQLDLGTAAPGMYIVVLENDMGQVQQRIIR